MSSRQARDRHPRASPGFLSGIPATVSASTINKVCGSGLKAAMFASQAIRAGDADLFVAGGFESMSRAPYLVSGRSGELKFGNQPLTDALLYDGLWDPFENWGMGNAAEFIADEYEVTREAMDQYALRSHQKAVEAQEKGRFEAEIVPVPIPGRKGEVTMVDRDEGPRKDTSLEVLAKLKPAFKPDGKVTPGNSSPMNDGGAAVVDLLPRLCRKKQSQANGQDCWICAGGGRTEISVCRAGLCHSQAA